MTPEIYLSQNFKTKYIGIFFWIWIFEKIDIDLNIDDTENRYEWNNVLCDIFDIKLAPIKKIINENNQFELLIHTGSSNETKNLSIERVKQLVMDRRIIDMSIVIYIDKKYKSLFQNLKNIKTKDYSKTSIEELENDILASEKILVNDSGPMHLVHKLGKRSVSVWGSTTPNT